MQLRYTIVALAVLAIACLFNVSCQAENSSAGTIHKAYLLPIWYTGAVDATVKGERIGIQARLQLNLASMKNADLRLEAGRGLRILDVKILSGADGKAATGDRIQDDLEMGASIQIEATLQAERGLKRGYVTLAFDYDFPEDELLQYIKVHRADLYPDDDLRRKLQQTVVESHRGRKAGGITTRIDLP